LAPSCKPRAIAQSGKPGTRVKPTPTKHRYGIPSLQLTKLPADRSESLVVLMLLIQMCLHWLMPVASGIGSPAARATIAQPAIKKIATQHRIWLAPIHAPPPRLSSWASAREACSRLARQWTAFRAEAAIPWFRGRRPCIVGSSRAG